MVMLYVFWGVIRVVEKTRLGKIALAGRWMRPNIDHAEHFIGALPYPGRRGKVGRRTDEQRCWTDGQVGYSR
jgi:hypothetical protein